MMSGARPESKRYALKRCGLGSTNAYTSLSTHLVHVHYAPEKHDYASAVRSPSNCYAHRSPVCMVQAACFRAGIRSVPPYAPLGYL